VGLSLHTFYLYLYLYLYLDYRGRDSVGVNQRE
jgi:hypothetical protein